MPTEVYSHAQAQARTARARECLILAADKLTLHRKRMQPFGIRLRIIEKLQKGKTSWLEDTLNSRAKEYEDAERALDFFVRKDEYTEQLKALTLKGRDNGRYQPSDPTITGTINGHSVELTQERGYKRNPGYRGYSGYLDQQALTPDEAQRLWTHYYIPLVVRDNSSQPHPEVQEARRATQAKRNALAEEQELRQKVDTLVKKLL